MNEEQKKSWDILSGPKLWHATVAEDGTLEIPPALLEQMVWEDGDTIYIDINEPGCIILSKL